MDITETSFSIGDYVIYRNAGVCRIDCIENKTFDDVKYEDYFRLVPIGNESASYYVPLSMASVRIRKPLTKEEIDVAIKSGCSEEITLTRDSRERKSTIDAILKSNDYSKIIALIKTIYDYTVSCRNSGKKVLVSDENALRNAENLLYPEFSFVLGIEENEVKDYIGRLLSA